MAARSNIKVNLEKCAQIQEFMWSLEANLVKSLLHNIFNFTCISLCRHIHYTVEMRVSVVNFIFIGDIDSENTSLSITITSLCVCVYI